MDLKKFKVFVRGENFLMNIDGVERRYGFYTTRFVEAQSEEEAELAVVNLLRNDPRLVQAVMNEKIDPPMMYAEEITELKSFGEYQVPGTGFSFF